MYNPYILVPLITWATAQFLKFVIAAAKGDLNLKYLYGSGGMPSVHSAVVASLATTALLVDGSQSAIFGITVIFAAIVMYDSFGVRRSVGEQAVAINRIVESVDAGSQHLGVPKLREILGHKPLEVSAGAILGITMGALLNFSYLGPFIAFLTQPIPPRPWAFVLAGVGLVAIILAFAMRTLYLKHYKKAHAMVRLIKWTTYSLIVYGVITLAGAFLIFQRIVGANWLLWLVVLDLAAVALAIGIVYYLWSPAQAEVAAIEADTEKARWMEGPNKKKRAKAARAKKRR